VTKAPKLANPDGGRAIPEWVGKHPDSVPPPHIRARIFQRGGGKCCLTGREIRPGDDWEAHHVIGLLEGGENRESNLAPALVDPHKEETAKQRKRKAKVDHTRIKHIGANDPSPHPIQSAGFEKSVRAKRGVDKSSMKPLARRDIFTGRTIE
jgi:5-methylcytosine-specific restriction protein A